MEITDSMKRFQNMSLKEICKYHVDMITAWNEQNFDSYPEHALKNSQAVFEFYKTQCAGNLFDNIGEIAKK